MKKLLLVSITVLGSFLCSAQFNTYHPFPHTNASWCQTDEWLDQSGYCTININVITEEYDYYVNGDTVVSGKSYIKVHTSGGYEVGTICPQPTWSSYDHLQCLLREDTIAKKVYISTNPHWGTDTLLYDFSLIQGEYLPLSYLSRGTSDSTYVLSIDSVLVGSSYRKQFIIAQYKSPRQQKFDSIIEGVGNMEGLLEWIYPQFEAYSNMTGFTNDSLTFPAGHGCSRFVLSTENIEKPTTSISVYPNPSKGIFTLTCHSKQSEESIPTIEIYSVLGSKVLTETLRSAQGDKTINLINQPNGLYLYRVIDENSNLIGEGKLVIQK